MGPSKILSLASFHFELFELLFCIHPGGDTHDSSRLGARYLFLARMVRARGGGLSEGQEKVNRWAVALANQVFPKRLTAISCLNLCNYCNYCNYCV